LRQPLERLEEALGSFACVDREVRSRGVADEEGVPCQDETLVDDEGAVLGPMSRRVQHVDGDPARLQHLPVIERVERELRLSDRMHGYRDAVLEGEAAVTRHVVRVRVRLEHADDTQAFLLGRLDVLLDCVRGVDQEGFAPVGISDQIRGTAEIVVDELAKNHEQDANTVGR
jgi:hypothetical protein